jgi:hypothetical protein
MVKKLLILFLLFCSLANADVSSVQYYPSSSAQFAAFNERISILNPSTFSSISVGFASTDNGHSCVYNVVAHVALSVGYLDYFNYCADGYMGPAPTLFAVSTGDIAFFILSLVGFGAWLLFRP